MAEENTVLEHRPQNLHYPIFEPPLWSFVLKFFLKLNEQYITQFSNRFFFSCSSRVQQKKHYPVFKPLLGSEAKTKDNKSLLNDSCQKKKHSLLFLNRFTLCLLLCHGLTELLCLSDIDKAKVNTEEKKKKTNDSFLLSSDRKSELLQKVSTPNRRRSCFGSLLLATGGNVLNCLSTFSQMLLQRIFKV